MNALFPAGSTPISTGSARWVRVPASSTHSSLRSSAGLEIHPYTATQIYLRLRDAGYSGGITIIKDYVHHVRPQRAPAFLTIAFAPGECAQVDWGQFGTITIGNTTRRLSFFAMVLCYNRKLYVEFTVSETMEHFLSCHQHAFEFFGGVPEKIMVDNLKSAVLRRLLGQAPVFNPRYKDFANHYGFKIVLAMWPKAMKRAASKMRSAISKRTFWQADIYRLLSRQPRNQDLAGHRS